ncbi:hypothetical protein HHI36_020061 [Cryptolaemus montrouzieri]|uniref:Centrosome-associated protein 350 n=1 Tax=Cryptolaemus montrouzieri TaxID=559131 RepID=A0ABD2N9U4_9CUCU
MERKVKNDSADVGKRINDTKREIAQLSEELDRLIHSNNSKEQHSNELIKSLKTQENQLKTLQGDNIALRTSNIDIASTKNLNSHGSVKGMDIKPESMCKKNKTYDKEAAKEYIRQQREKREEYRKKMSSKTKIDLELKKQKLYELQQKSLALVQRNLELKRERSRSRENKQEIRIDRNNFIKSGHSLDRKTSSNITVDRKPSTETKSSFSKFFKSPDRKNVKGNKVQVKSKGYMKDPTPQLGDQNTSKISSRGRSTLKNITFRSQEFPSKSCELSYADQNLAATKIQACYKGYLVRKHQSEKKLKVKSEHCIMTDNCAKESKETQTKMRKQSPEMPVWLQPPPIDPYPCNFINTIKRKLQFVVNSPVSSRDIGVQSSIIASSSAGPNKGSKVKETIKESLKSNEKQNLNSFLSHRCFNLDADALKHLALVHSENKSGQNVNKHEKSDSESDTSKNIPEISTESGSAPLNVRSVPVEQNNNSEIKTENSSISDNSKDRVSKEELSDKMVSNKDRSSSIPDSHKSEVTPIEIIENIENSINTSLVSHISDNRSDLSDHSKQEHLGSSQYSLKTKHERSGHSKASTEKNSLKKTLIRDTSTNIPKMSENSDILSERSLKPSIPTNSISSHIEADTSKSNKENIPSIDKVSSNDKTGAHSSEKTTDISVSSQITDGKDGMFKSSEFVSLYSSNFSSEKSDSNNVSLKSISKKNTLTEPIESHKTSQNDQVQSNLNLKNQSKSNSTNIEVDDVNRPMETVNTAVIQTKADMNEIHLKFEAEVHLLNDFNESLKQFMAVEKAFEIIKNKNEISSTKHHSRNSQNSKNSTRATLSEDSKVSVNLSKSLISSINVSRGSDIGDSPFLQDDLFRKPWDKLNDSSGLEISNVDQNLSKDESNFTINEKMPNNLAGLSIKMFEQLIKDEDVRIENLKTIIKIREQALLDRTKGELAWLEIQRKHLKETGRIQEASLVKKKQRGILLKHQQERREMQRLKQLQKIQSNERKTILKEQKNLIKAKLTSEKIMSELRIHTPRRRKSSGPMKVLKSSESIHSETSVSKRASDGEEIISVTSRSHSVRLSEIESSRDLIVDKNEMDMNMVADHKNLSHMKK